MLGLETSHVPPEIRRELEAWLLAWGECVRHADIATARLMFDPHVLGFGTLVARAHGIAQLANDQWAAVWPTIGEFTFEVAHLACAATGDACLAVIAVPWRSVGRTAEGAPFDRPGRATIVLRRTETTAPWRAIHTHFSLNPPDGAA